VKSCFEPPCYVISYESNLSGRRIDEISATYYFYIFENKII